MMQLKTEAAASVVLTPKVRGTQLLAEVFKDEPLDFFVLFSNSLGLTGAAGQADYCAASAFLDAFAQGGARRETFTVAVDWYLPQWEDWVGAAAGAGGGVGAEFAETRALYGIGLCEGVEAFARVLGGTEPQVVVSTQDFPALIERQKEQGRADLLEQLEAARAAGEAPVGGEVEETVAAIWRQLFGVEEVGANDNFFDLGGNSLLAIQLVAQLCKAFRMELPLAASSSRRRWPGWRRAFGRFNSRSRRPRRSNGSCRRSKRSRWKSFRPVSPAKCRRATATARASFGRAQGAGQTRMDEISRRLGGLSPRSANCSNGGCGREACHRRSLHRLRPRRPHAQTRPRVRRTR